jgi:hypothetical protein
MNRLMRLITAGFRAFRPFSRIWVFLFAVALVLALASVEGPLQRDLVGHQLPHS